MKAGWRTCKIGEACSLATGGTPSRSNPEYFEGGQIRWLVSGDIHRHEIMDCDGRISQLGLENSNARPLPVNSVIVALNGQGKTRGSVALLRTEATCNQSLVSIYPNNPEELLPEYLFWNLHGRYEEIRRITGDDGNERRGLNMPLIRNIEVPIAPIEEQRRIVAALDEAVAAIAIASENAEKSLANVSALLDAIIASSFSGHLGGPQIENVVVEDLAVARKGSMRTGPFGSQLLHGEFVDDGVAVLGIDNAVANVFQWGKRRFISEEKFESLSRFQVYPGDVVITIMGTCGRCAVIPDDIPRAINSKHLFCISLDPGRCLPGYLHAYFLYAPEARAYLEERAQGSIMAGLNMSIIREMPVRLPSVEIQGQILSVVERAKRECDSLARTYKLKLQKFAELRQSVLQMAFSGELVTAATVEPARADFTTVEFTAQVIAFAHYRHERQRSQKTFGHVKAQKALHLVESIGGIDLGRGPIKDAAGPNDFPHMLRATDWAVQQGFFEFVPRAGGKGYDFRKLANYAALWASALDATRPVAAALERAIDPIVPMVSLDAEVFATVHAAWNNLLRDGVAISNDAIVKEARENWHSDKLIIPELKFRAAIKAIRTKGVVPDGTAKYVGGQSGLF